MLATRKTSNKVNDKLEPFIVKEKSHFGGIFCMCVRLNVVRIVFEIIKIFCYCCKLSTALFCDFSKLMSM